MMWFGLRRLLLVTILGCVAAVGLLSAAELAVRRFWPQEHLPPDLFVADRSLGYRVARNYRGEHVTREFTVPLITNSLGLRDREYGPPPEGGLRIYFLGDSFIFGNRVVVEETVTKVLENVLRKRLPGRHVEVVNGGMPGYSTIQELKLFEETVDQVQPDIVLLGICVANDIWDNFVYAQRNIREGGGGAWRAGAGGFRARTTLLLKHSDLYLLVRRTYNRVFRGDESRQEAHARRPPEMLGTALQLTEDAVLGFAQGARQRGVGFAVLLITVPGSVIPDATQDELNAEFSAFAAREGIAVHDLAPAFDSHPADEMYFTVHWTPRGHEIVAEAIADYLLHSGLLGTAAAMAARAG